ncbi:MAG: TIGR03013 family PEP-CTERM/XrtA system glycosyltransferase, partial [Planctomycetes bacterium]|nr:TIGR03013 family PEP-CTERM/XrtA system glycosyltransferase [Planctomycetota bacterium]
SNTAGPGPAVFEDLTETKLLLAPAPGARLELAPTGAGHKEPLPELCARLKIDLIVVAFEERRGSLPTDELLACRLDGVQVQEAEFFFERLTGKIPAEAMRPSYLIFNPGFEVHPLAAVAKRLVDFVLALLSLVVLGPLMLAVALAVRLDSPGPVLFRQERVGRRGRGFTLCKFRSMRSDAEKLTGPVWASEDDPRVTRVGRWIRKTRMDELPQLFNILAGSMSLVGPRPERQHFVAELAQKLPYYNQRHSTKPGLTGWAQINYPYGNTVEDALQKLQYDLFYIKYQSLLFDLSILFHTVKTVLLRRGT